MTPCNWDDLEALAGGELEAARAAMVEAHAASCPSCGGELAWLRAERELMARRAAAAAPLPATLWQSLERRLPEEAARRRAVARHFLVRATTAVGLAFAAAIVLTGKFHVSRDFGHRRRTVAEHSAKRAEREVDRALDQAERAYREAISALENEYKQRPEGKNPEIAQRHEARLSALRKALDQAREAAGDDSEARLQLLDAYSTYMRSVQTAVLEEAVLEEEVEK